MTERDICRYLRAEKRDVAILINPRAGSGPSRDVVDQFLRDLQRHGFKPRPCRHRSELSSLLREEGPKLRCVVAAGGDGTVAEVVNRAVDMPLAILPVGNENLAADYFGFRRSAWRLAQAVAVGRTQRFDLGRVNDRRFVLVASTGIDAVVVAEVHRRRRGHISRLNWLLPILETLSSYRWPTIEVEVLETGERLQGKEVLVFNLPRYALRLPLAPQAAPDDGLLDLLVLQEGGVRALAEFLFSVLTSRRQLPRHIHRRKVKRLRLWSDNRLPLQSDGDPGFALPVTIEVLPSALELVLPCRL
jgi:diacylglycerol kinase family enzyme